MMNDFVLFPQSYTKKIQLPQISFASQDKLKNTGNPQKEAKSKINSLLPLISTGAIAAGLLLVGLAKKKKISLQEIRKITKTVAETEVKNTPRNVSKTISKTSIPASSVISAPKEQRVGDIWKDLQFTKASTMEEAKAYAENILGVKSFNLENDLVTANWFNEGMTNLQNMYKGKFKIPDKVYFITNSTAGNHCPMAIRHPSNSKITEFVINKDFLKSNESLEHIKEITTTLENKGALAFKDGKYKYSIINRERLAPLFEDLAALRNGTKKFEPLEINALARGLDDYVYSCYYKNIYKEASENLYKHPEKLAIIKSKIPNFPSLAEIKKMSNEQLDNLISEVFEKTGISPDVAYGVHHFNKFDLMYHEGGHLMHGQLVPNKFFAYHNSAPKGEVPSNASKDLLDFLNDPKKQETAFRVSRYAQHSPLEFVAETHIGLCNGFEFPEDVMNLYKYYEGPVPVLWKRGS